MMWYISSTATNWIEADSHNVADRYGEQLFLCSMLDIALVWSMIFWYRAPNHSVLFLWWCWSSRKFAVNHWADFQRRENKFCPVLQIWVLNFEKLELFCFINNIRTKEQSISKYNKTNKGHSSINSATLKGKYYSEGNLPTSTENDDQSWWLPVRCNNQTPPTSLHYVLYSRFTIDSLRPSLEMVFLTV